LRALAERCISHEVGRLQERFEQTVAGRVVISAFIVVTLVTLLTANLPASRLESLLLSADHPYLYGAGLDQSWGVFSPDPRRETIHITAEVTFADGSRSTWNLPTRDPFIGAYTDYRWLKWTEYLVSPAYSNLWQPAAIYVARRFATAQRRPTRVALMNKWYDLPPPGQAQNQPIVSQRSFYATAITSAMLAGKHA
jgi:hypothetical protein